MTAKIGLYLKRMDWHDPNIASDRIRGTWVMQCCPDIMEAWQAGRDYTAVIFHNPVGLIAQTPGVALLDVCDPMWLGDPTGFKRTVAPVAGIVVATAVLRQQVLQLGLNVPVRVIGDGHWYPYYATRQPNPHTARARTVVWFGYADNAFACHPLLPAIAGAGLRLKVIAERNPLGQAVDFVPWGLDTCVQDISACDFAVLPFTQPHKTNNKDVSALLCGIPVAKTAADIARLVDPLARQAAMALAPDIIAQHSVHARAAEYLDWIQALWLARTR